MADINLAVSHCVSWGATRGYTLLHYIHYIIVRYSYVASWPWSPAPLLAVCPQITSCLASQITKEVLLNKLIHNHSIDPPEIVTQ